ncbi:thioredoxin trx1 [Coemansia sp. IMI 209128]|nr:thioredoxin trx1 [Coemansia sp. S85]KAJ2695759.1 thioredoxin trx1 [Coemansia sp. IMI 209128]
MPVISISDLSELRTVIRANNRVIVNFGRSECKGCQFMDPIYRRLSDEYDNIAFVLVDIGKKEAMVEKYKIELIPTFKFFEHSVEAGEVAGTIVCSLKEGVKMLSAV